MGNLCFTCGPQEARDLGQMRSQLQNRNAEAQRREGGWGHALVLRCACHPKPSWLCLAVGAGELSGFGKFQWNAFNILIWTLSSLLRRDEGDGLNIF